MCNPSGIIFAVKNLTPKRVKGKEILEVGSYDANGSVRPLIELYKPKKYVGVDITEGPGVDFVCNAEELVHKFGEKKFDIIISTEMLEHVLDWKQAVTNMKRVCKMNGLILITTRSKGFPYHAHPHDFWRYEIDDMKNIFSDCKILALESDSQAPGVFLLAQKTGEKEIDLSNYQCYNMIARKRTNNSPKKSLRINILTLKNKLMKFMSEVVIKILES